MNIYSDRLKITCAAILVKSSLHRIFFSRSRYDVHFARGSRFNILSRLTILPQAGNTRRVLCCMPFRCQAGACNGTAKDICRRLVRVSGRQGPALLKKPHDYYPAGQ